MYVLHISLLWSEDFSASSITILIHSIFSVMCGDFNILMDSSPPPPPPLQMLASGLFPFKNVVLFPH